MMFVTVKGRSVNGCVRGESWISGIIRQQKLQSEEHGHCFDEYEELHDSQKFDVCLEL